MKSPEINSYIYQYIVCDKSFNEHKIEKFSLFSKKEKLDNYI